MEQTKIEVALIEEVIAEAAIARRQELNDLQLVMAGGGMADASFF